MSATVFTNGSLFDGHRYVGRVGAVVVRDARVAAVLPPGAELPAGTVVDLAGGLLTPGFIDAHVHAVQGGLELGDPPHPGGLHLGRRRRRPRRLIPTAAEVSAVEIRRFDPC